MSTVKTAISIDKDLFEQIEIMSKELNLSRSKVFATAIKNFLEQYENKKMFDALNTAYDDKPGDAEQKLQNNHRKHHERLVKSDGY